MDKEKPVVGIRVSVPLVREIGKLLNLSPDTPVNYAVDSELRELRERLKKEVKA